MRFRPCVLALALNLACFISPSPARQSSPSPTPSPGQEVPTIDGNAGPCSVEFTVTDGQGKGVYSANVKVHMAYGFGGVRKLDLEAGTNSDGKVKFKGLPAKVHNPVQLIQSLCALGYALRSTWPVYERSLWVPLYPEISSRHYRGFYFVKTVLQNGAERSAGLDETARVTA